MGVCQYHACSSVQVEITMVQLQCQVSVNVHMLHTSFYYLLIFFLLPLPHFCFLYLLSYLSIPSTPFSPLFLLSSILPLTLNRFAIHISVQVHRTGLYKYRATDLEVLPIDWIS